MNVLLIVSMSGNKLNITLLLVSNLSSLLRSGVELLNFQTDVFSNVDLKPLTVSISKFVCSISFLIIS